MDSQPVNTRKRRACVGSSKKSSTGVTPTRVVSKIKRAKITKEFSAIPNIQIMASPNPSLFKFSSASTDNNTVTVDLLKSLFAENSNCISKTLDEKFKLLNDTISLQNTKIESLEKGVLSLQHEVSKISSENEYLWKEVLRSNLVFVGIVDNENESRELLVKSISKIIHNRINNVNIQVDSAYRIGNFVQGRSRHVKVKFRYNSDRELVFENRLKFNPQIFVNEDLPRLTRRDHAILRQHKKKLVSEGADPRNIRVDWNRKSIKSESNILVVKNGQLEQSAPFNSQDSSQGKKSHFSKQFTHDLQNHFSHKSYLPGMKF